MFLLHLIYTLQFYTQLMILLYKSFPISGAHSSPLSESSPVSLGSCLFLIKSPALNLYCSSEFHSSVLGNTNLVYQTPSMLGVVIFPLCHLEISFLYQNETNTEKFIPAILLSLLIHFLLPLELSHHYLLLI